MPEFLKGLAILVGLPIVSLLAGWVAYIVCRVIAWFLMVSKEKAHDFSGVVGAICCFVCLMGCITYFSDDRPSKSKYDYEEDYDYGRPSRR